MNPTSSLIAGGVLLFGAAGLANLYLPAPGTNFTQTLMRTSESRAKPRSTVTLHAYLSSTSPSSSLFLRAAHNVDSIVTSSTVKPTAGSLPVASSKHIALTNRVGASTPPVSRNVFSAHPATDHVHSRIVRRHVIVRPQHREFVNFAKRRAALEKRGPVVVYKKGPSPLQNNSVSAWHTPVSMAVHGTSHAAFALSATLGNRAWIRIGNHRTILVMPGDLVPGLGHVKAIYPGSVFFDNGKTLRTAP